MTEPEAPAVILAAFAIYTKGHLLRPTEYWGLFLMLRGYIPSIALVNERLPKSRTRANHADDGRILVTHQQGRLEVFRDEYKYCPECGQYKRRDRRYWHRDAKGSDGYQTICATCRCKQESERIRNKRAV